MAASLGSGSVRSEINVTPLIDVVLVLLIIFMVLTPTLETRFDVALPRREPEERPAPTDAPLVVELRADGTTLLGGEVLDRGPLAERLAAALAGRPDEERVVFFEAADAANYGLAVDVMDLCRRAGAVHIGMIEPEPAADLAAGPR